ncbi:hypothetical protein QTJ16_000648 [Diplocarpon rosae]|uniref:F-box domain-containing protein n=1 Tax=Diplocarpon rosae TaxID=946125 RepID=A0AAD9T4F4_9HELO|nr:hypothetical protein QTJ16_000648 [Diplocarpon rosae]
MAGAMTPYEGSPQDEGYSEDPLTVANAGSLPSWVAKMPPPERMEYVMNIISGLPTWEVAEIVTRLRHRLHINFLNYMPPEVCLKVLGFLDPASLINTARASREWMALALDRRLWQELYVLEGFKVIQSEVDRFEASLNVESPGGERARPAGQNDEGHASKRRATPQRIIQQADMDYEMQDVDMVAGKQKSIFGGRIAKEPIAARSGSDIPMASCSRNQQFPSRVGKSLPTRLQVQQRSTEPPLSSISSLVTFDKSDNRKKLNWQYLYSQRRRLEANWDSGKYTNFQLPHPNHPQEAHDECIYTIQHSGRYLVSGSRDKSIRIWDLDTRRLVRAPLRAHTGSVLCLQFDADPEEDLIVSGSSDASIVLWKFSTGQLVQRVRNAHRESVLNVRFDKRVLVTCSKDKTIKVFNRRALKAGDPGYRIGDGVHPVPTYLNNYGFNPAPTSGLPMKPAFSIIASLEGHGAAVNAVQIHGDEVVSASGDRTVKVWNWTDSTCSRTLVGHQKGIACVQYDGRRIVSGSSDNEVKIFDSESGLEVASLRAHSNLVRTVQAGFGDSPYSAEEDRETAKRIDNEYFAAIDAGEVPQAVQLQRSRPRNAGSRKPEDITAYGAKVPPGGGGGRFGRIVSGSYDETIIIWRRDKEGIWKAQHTLRQEQGALAASRAIVPERSTTDESVASQSSQSTAPPVPVSMPSIDVDAPPVPFAPMSDQFYRHLIAITVPRGPVALQAALNQHARMAQYQSSLLAAIEELPATAEHIPSMIAIVETAFQAWQEHQGPLRAAQVGPLSNAVLSSQAGPQSQHSPSLYVGSSSQAGLSQQAPSPPQAPQPMPVAPSLVWTTGHNLTPPQLHQTTSTIVPTPQPQQPPTQPAPASYNPSAQLQPQPAPHHHHHHHHAHHFQQSMARVFKLQFDARRIICCSQTSTIVGWDFAADDEKIIEASRFFAAID